MHVGDLTLPGNLKITTHAEETIVTVGAKVEEKEEEVVPEEGAPEGPEVIKEKDKEGKEEEQKEKRE